MALIFDVRHSEACSLKLGSNPPHPGCQWQIKVLVGIPEPKTCNNPDVVGDYIQGISYLITCEDLLPFITCLLFFMRSFVPTNAGMKEKNTHLETFLQMG